MAAKVVITVAGKVVMVGTVDGKVVVVGMVVVGVAKFERVECGRREKAVEFGRKE